MGAPYRMQGAWLGTLPQRKGGAWGGRGGAARFGHEEPPRTHITQAVERLVLYFRVLCK